MQEQIVISIDPLNVPHNVLDYALELARASQKQLLIYSVQGMPMLSQADGGLTSPGLEYVPGAMEASQEVAEQLLEKISEQYPNVKLEHGPGFQAPSTIHKMEEIEGDSATSCLLVMPKTHGHNWWNKAIGTTETTVASAVHCPALFVPEGAAYRGISRVMYLVDTKALMDGRYKGFRFLRRFADLHCATIVVGFIYDLEAHDQLSLGLGEAMDSFKESLPFQISHEYRFFLNQSADEIIGMANVTNTDVVAFPMREASLFERFFEHEMTRELVLKADLPVLVF